MLWIWMGCTPVTVDSPPVDSAPAGDSTDTQDTQDTSGPDDTAVDTGRAAETRVYLLAGQSNMVGYGPVHSLPPSLREPQPDAQIYWSGAPRWRGLQPSSAVTGGHGVYFGPEVLFGRTLQDVWAGDDVRLIKHAVGGTDLAAYWYPGTDRDDPAMGDGYRVFIETVEAGLAELDAPRVVGMAWMQGESDALDATWADRYETNLSHLIERVRQDVSTPDLPVVIGEIDCIDACPYNDTVVSAMRAVAAADPAVHTVPTDDLRKFPNDYWHYQGTGQRILGTRMAQALVNAERAPAVVPAVSLTGAYSYSYTGNYTVGWRFTTDRALTLTDLGVFDLGGDGLAHSSEIVLWDASTGDRVLGETLPATAAAPTTSIEGFRYVAIEPVELPAGDWIVTNQAFGTNPDYYVYAAQIATQPGVTYTEARHNNGSAQIFPTVAVETDTQNAAWFGANLLFQDN